MKAIGLGNRRYPRVVVDAWRQRRSGNLVLSWTASTAPVTSYILEAGSATGLSNLVVSDTGSTATSLTATAGAGVYFVRVRARSSCGTSASSNEITVIVGGTTTPTQWVPEGIRLTNIAAGFPGSLADVSAFQLKDERWRIHVSAVLVAPYSAHSRELVHQHKTQTDFFSDHFLLI